MIRIIIVVLSLLILTNCATTRPIVDSRGKSSANIEGDMDRYDDDYYTCKAIAEDNTNEVIEGFKKAYNFTRFRVLWLAPKVLDKKQEIIKRCLQGRGYVVLWN